MTVGDIKPVLEHCPPRGTEIYQLRGRDLPKTFDGLEIDDHHSYPLARTPDGDLIVQVENVSDVTGAQAVIRNLDRDIRLRNVFFLGHGSGQNGFLFSGRPSGPGRLDAMTFDDAEQRFMLSREHAADGKFMDDNKRLIQAIGRRLAPGYAGIWFLACFVGLSHLHNAVADVLSQQGRKEFFVGAYDDFYEVNVRGELLGTTDVSHEIDGTEFTTTVPRMRRFAHWSDRILRGTDVLINSSGPNRIPRFQVIDGRGQFFLDFLRPTP